MNPLSKSPWAKEIQSAYEAMTQKTVEDWTLNPGIGKEPGLPSGYHHLGLTIGTHAKFSSEVLNVLAEAEELSRGDSSLAFVPQHCRHFTFLAISKHSYAEKKDLPSNLSLLRNKCEKHLRDMSSWTIKDIRLVPGKNFVLLAGIPDEKTFQKRVALANDLISIEPWKTLLEQRHREINVPFPPLFWHTTFFRCKNERMPQKIREWFHKHRNSRFGDMCLEAPKYYAATYDWSKTVEF